MAALPATTAMTAAAAASGATQPGQRCPGLARVASQPPCRSRAHRAGGDLEYLRDLADIEVGVITQDEYLTLPVRQ
jgi:hypothetical protein